jgi:peroxiredoxin (alkyl hydroperoxide reductase subunit C)
MDNGETAFTSTMPRLNEPAPDFTQVSTAGPLTLKDFRGKWVVLFSHPADFTPVCTTEFVAFAELYDDFVSRNVQLVGLSIDSVHAHIAWLMSIEANFGVQVKFPILADLDMKVAKAYGMIQPGASTTAAVRAVFVIDPDGILRAMIYYPLSTGRNMAELLRLVDALQCNTAHGLATPANWQPGDACIVPAPVTKAGADKRPSEGFDTVDWYFSRTPQPVG